MAVMKQVFIDTKTPGFQSLQFIIERVAPETSSYPQLNDSSAYAQDMGRYGMQRMPEQRRASASRSVSSRTQQGGEQQKEE